MKKKGFTLIELLAVIVILAIIALIVTPVVSKIIDSAKDSANARSVEGHVKNVEYAIIENAYNSSAQDLAAYNSESGTQIVDNLVLPGGDNIRCQSYEIKDGIVINAYDCTKVDNTWSKSYDYTTGRGAYVNVATLEQTNLSGTADSISISYK